MVVTHANSDTAFKAVEQGDATFYIKAGSHITKIDAKTILKFKKLGYDVLSKDKDDRGFRMQSGKSRLYIFAGQLVLG